ncbi:unnamed protein product [Brassicogethes aeneus]|uniref:Uncharacterized protein n=1 Tax=Brassicogethes aeneus TaxID=1431903 RepID=A0A9P0AS78_BRAAE|nr:unnamed protein product [Brassicogethes aeneus]
MIFKIYLVCLLFSFVCSISKHPILIVVSYDAFRYNYFDTKMVPNMEKLRKAGTYSDYLINVFPTKTFPNHHSIATGLYPDIHGVIGNTYYDPKVKSIKGMSYEMYHYDDHVIPIWRWNEDMEDGRYSASMMWPGAAYDFQNKNITHVKSYDPNYDWFKRIDDVINWIKHPTEPANLVMVYFEEPDTHGHAFGPNSKVVLDLLQKLDNVTKYLDDQLKKNNLDDHVNVIHLSDHGMIAVTPPKFINITQYLTNGTYQYAGASPCIQIIPKEGHKDEIYDKLKKASIKNKHFTVYKKEEFFERWHYSNDRAPEILIMAEEGYALEDLIVAAPIYAHKYNFTLTNSSEFGVHGYDYTMKDMHPFFMARGPKIKKHHKVAPFNTVDLFDLFCEILDITPTHNNGTLANILDILSNNKNGKYSIASILVITVGGVVVTIILVSLAAIVTLILIKRQQNITTAAALNKRFPQTFQSNIEAQHLLEPEDA